MIDPTPENPEYIFDKADIEIAILTDPSGGSHRLLKLRLAMRPVPPPVGSTGPVLASTPWMYIPLDKADELVGFLQKGLERIRSVPQEPSSRQ